jgi:hypothetical protein
VRWLKKTVLLLNSPVENRKKLGVIGKQVGNDLKTSRSFSQTAKEQITVTQTQESIVPTRQDRLTWKLLSTRDSSKSIFLTAVTGQSEKTSFRFSGMTGSFSRVAWALIIVVMMIVLYSVAFPV